MNFITFVTAATDIRNLKLNVFPLSTLCSCFPHLSLNAGKSKLRTKSKCTILRSKLKPFSWLEKSSCTESALPNIYTCQCTQKLNWLILVSKSFHGIIFLHQLHFCKGKEHICFHNDVQKKIAFLCWIKNWLLRWGSSDGGVHWLGLYSFMASQFLHSHILLIIPTVINPTKLQYWWHFSACLRYPLVPQVIAFAKLGNQR